VNPPLRQLLLLHGWRFWCRTIHLRQIEVRFGRDNALLRRSFDVLSELCFATMLPEFKSSSFDHPSIIPADPYDTPKPPRGRAAHLLRDRLARAQFQHEVQKDRPHRQNLSQDRPLRRSVPISTLEPSSTSRTHSESVCPFARVRSSSMANSASLTFVPTDLVRSGFTRHRRWDWEGDLGRAMPARCRLRSSRGSNASGRGLRGCNSSGSPSATRARL
jgi:hypothetical protein